MEDESVVVNKEEEEEEEMVDVLPPGFRFHPTDEEIITHYLTPKLVNTTFVSTAIGEVDLNKCEPWDLPKRAKMGEREWYFFCQRDRKYPTGTRTNRATESGYWKATGKDKEIFKAAGKQQKQHGGCLVGMKKTLVFYRGRAPKGDKTNWVMHEFRLDPNFAYHNHLPKVAKDEWVVCRVFQKSSGIIKRTASNLMIPGTSHEIGLSRIISMDNLFNSPPPLVDPAKPSQTDFNEEDDDDDIREYNYYPSLDHHDQPLIYNNNSYNNNNNNAYQMIMNQFSSCSKPVFPSSSLQGGGLMMMPRPQSCKAEQFSSNHDSTVITRSQDTGLSTDVNNNTTEISSSNLHNDNNNIGISGEIPDHVADIDCLWDF